MRIQLYLHSDSNTLILNCHQGQQKSVTTKFVTGNLAALNYDNFYRDGFTIKL